MAKLAVLSPGWPILEATSSTNCSLKGTKMFSNECSNDANLIVRSHNRELAPR
jgi:hypothetical protein